MCAWGAWYRALDPSLYCLWLQRVGNIWFLLILLFLFTPFTWMRFLLGSCCCFSIILWKQVKLLSYSNLPSNTFYEAGKEQWSPGYCFSLCCCIWLKMKPFRHVMVLCLSHVHSFTRCWNPSSREGSLMLAQSFTVGGPELNPVSGKKSACLMTIKRRNW